MESEKASWATLQRGLRVLRPFKKPLYIFAAILMVLAFGIDAYMTTTEGYTFPTRTFLLVLVAALGVFLLERTAAKSKS